jgi:hypothetical protein
MKTRTRLAALALALALIGSGVKVALPSITAWFDPAPITAPITAPNQWNGDSIQAPHMACSVAPCDCNGGEC